MYNDIRKILEIAIRAPSGDNCQPWKLEVEGATIRLYNDVTKDTSLYNFNQIAANIALGALIENIIIASSKFGYKVDLNLFPQGVSESEHLVAVMNLQAEAVQPNPLFDSIEKRHNNRKPYSIEKISEENKKEIFDAGADLSGVELRMVDDLELINSIAAAGSKNEKLVLENEKLHGFLFNHIVWTEKTAKEKGDGIYIRTLEMPRPAELIFKVCSNWEIMKNLAKIGLSSVIAKQNQQIYMRAGAYGAIVLKSDGRASIIQAGRLIERTWLAATKLGLSFNVMAGIVLLKYRTDNDANHALSDKEIKLVNESYKEIAYAFKIKDDEFIPFVFRIGKSANPSAYSYRLLLDKVVVFK